MNASVVVAVAAIVVASVFNVLALRRSSRTLSLAEQSYARTEQRYQEERREARNDRLRNIAIEVTMAVTAFNRENAWFAKLMTDFATGHVKVGEVQDQDVQKLRPAATEVYRAIQVLLFLTDDVAITGIVREIERQVFAASNVVNTHEVTPAGIQRAGELFKQQREVTAAKAAELLEATHRLVK